MIHAIYPGEVLAEELEERGIGGAEAARALGVAQCRISNIMRGKTGITADTALRPGSWRGTGPEHWLNKQKDYELHLAEATHGRKL